MLQDEHCQSSITGAKGLTPSQISQLLAELSAWELHQETKIPRLSKVYKFTDYRSGLDFAMALGMLAETENHHPLIEISWGEVMVQWWSHALAGLHRNDFIMAAKTEALYNQLLEKS